MLNNRMVEVAQPVVNKFQTGGLPDRAIQMSVFLIHLIISLFKKKDWAGYIVALDNIKAFDKITREYIFYVLKHMGFDLWTIQRIRTLYGNTKARLILNGYLSESFLILCGVKQGCPLSALLFALAMEPLARSILDDPLFVNFGFRLPGNMELRVIQHLDDMTLFAHNYASVVSFMEKVSKFNSFAGTKINYLKSFIIRIDNSSNVLADDGRQLCGIKVLEPGVCRKILGVYFGSDIKLYIEKNWWAVYNKCVDALAVWSVCLSTADFTSLMGRALIVHVMIHSKLTYLMQTMQYFLDPIQQIDSKVQNFLWAGKKHIPKIPLKVLEAPLKLGGIGLKPLAQKAISLRFEYIRTYFERSDENWAQLRSPIQAIIGHVLDQSVFRLVPEMSREVMVPLTQSSIYHKPGSIEYIEHLPDIFDILYWDIERAISVIGSVDFFSHYTSKNYLEDLMEKRTIKLRQTTIQKAFISRFCYSEQVEQAIWDKINLKQFQPKIKAFAFKLAHNCLPTKYDIWRITKHFKNNNHDPWCNYCKLTNNELVPCAAQHIFIKCPLAKLSWTKINEALRGAKMQPFTVDDYLVYFRKNLNSHGAFFVTEILWALWRVNNRNNYEVENDVRKLWQYKKVFSIIVSRVKFAANIDKAIYSNKVYGKRWRSVIGLLEASFAFDTG